MFWTPLSHGLIGVGYPLEDKLWGDLVSVYPYLNLGQHSASFQIRVVQHMYLHAPAQCMLSLCISSKRHWQNRDTGGCYGSQLRTLPRPLPQRRYARVCLDVWEHEYLCIQWRNLVSCTSTGASHGGFVVLVWNLCCIESPEKSVLWMGRKWDRYVWLGEDKGWKTMAWLRLAGGKCGKCSFKWE